MDDATPDEAPVTVVVGQERPDVTAPIAQVWETDALCADAVDVARAALLEEASDSVIGAHCGLVADGPLVVTHYFEGSVPGYTGWRWAVTLTRAPDSEQVTVDETALLPDGEALLAPAWVPWKQRIESGDLGAGDLLVTEAGDPRLLPGLSDTDGPDADEQLQPVAWELGLGRVRILSPEGRREAAQRWYREVGPRSPGARGADLECASCGFLVVIGGPLGQAFGVCANGYSPSDGRIVAMTYGCGAHSETVEVPPANVAETVVDEFGYDEVVDDGSADGSVGTEPEPHVEGETSEAADEEVASEALPDGQDVAADVDPGEPNAVDVSDHPGAADVHATMQEPIPEEDA